MASAAAPHDDCGPRRRTVRDPKATASSSDGEPVVWCGEFGIAPGWGSWSSPRKAKITDADNALRSLPCQGCGVAGSSLIHSYSVSTAAVRWLMAGEMVLRKSQGTMVRVGTRIDKDKDIFSRGAISVLCLVTAAAIVQLDLGGRIPPTAQSV